MAFFEDGCDVAHFPLSGMFPDHHHLSKMVEGGLARSVTFHFFLNAFCLDLWISMDKVVSSKLCLDAHPGLGLSP